MSIETIIVQVEQPTVVVRTGVPGPEGPPGTAEGDVAGPAASADGELPVFDGTTGKRLKQGTYTLATLLAAAREWANLTGKPATFSPAAHKASHATGGSDALTPSDIGAAAAAHGHDLSAIGQSGASVGQAAVWNGSAWAPATISGGLPIAHTAASGEIPLQITAHSGGTVAVRARYGSNARVDIGLTPDVPYLRLQDAYGSSGGLYVRTVYGRPTFQVNGSDVFQLDETPAARFVGSVIVGNAFGAGATYEVCAPTGDYGYASLHLRVRGGAGQASATATARHGGNLTLTGGAAGTYAGQSGNGGSVTIRGGDPTGGGTRGGVFILDLPSADPHVVGQLWLSGTTPQISAG